MGRFTDPSFLPSKSGSRIVSQYRLGKRGTASTPPSAPATASARFLPMTIATVDWTADTALYPDAPDLGTLYYADINHNLGNDRAVVVALQSEAGLSPPGVVLHFQTTEDPTTPGSRRPNHTRIWITSDSSPAVALYAIVLG